MLRLRNHKIATRLYGGILLMALSLNATQAQTEQSDQATVFAQRASSMQLEMIQEMQGLLQKTPRLPVIIKFSTIPPKDSDSKSALMERPDMQERLAQLYSLLSAEAIANNRTYKHLPLFTADINAEELDSLMQSEWVESIEVNGISFPQRNSN